jgi:hypothetical protein
MAIYEHSNLLNKKFRFEDEHGVLEGVVTAVQGNQVVFQHGRMTYQFTLKDFLKNAVEISNNSITKSPTKEPKFET